MEMWSAEWKEAVNEAMWDNNRERLDELRASCDCCCDEHTFESCGARYVGDCRGQNAMTHTDLAGWMKHYGMCSEEFYPAPDDASWIEYIKSVYTDIDGEEEVC